MDVVNIRSFQEFKCQIGNKSGDVTCYIDLFSIESFEIEEDTILIGLNSGIWKRVYSTTEEFIEMIDRHFPCNKPEL